MKDYTTLIFDAFDTVVHIQRDRLPASRLNGETIFTTAPAVHPVYTRHFGTIGFDAFYKAFSQSFAEISAARETDLREIASQERFRALLRCLGQDAVNADPAILEELTLAHMHELQKVFEIRPETIEFLKWAAPRYRRAMISNFDYAPALYHTLERYGVRSEFEVIMVSVEVGWRKPHPAIFERTFHQLQIRPAEALYIGDQLYLDVLGSVQAGMDVVWLDGGRERWTEKYPKPTYRVRSIMEVMRILENKS